MSVGLATIVRHLLAAFSYALICVSPAHADGFRWPQPGGPGTPVFLTYSFSNLLDGTFGPWLATKRSISGTCAAGATMVMRR